MNSAGDEAIPEGQDRITIALDLTLRPLLTAEFQELRRVMVGGPPIVLITPTRPDPGTILFTVDGTGFQDEADLAGTLEAIAEALRSGVYLEKGPL